MSIAAVNRKGVACVGNGVEVKQSLIPDAGKGLFATVAFDKNDYITEYDGFYMSKDEARSLSPRKTTHFRTADSDTVIDGFKDPMRAVGHGGASFANDGKRPGSNNSKFKRVWDSKFVVYRVFLVATERIEPGDEILVSYGNNYWKRFG